MNKRDKLLSEINELRRTFEPDSGYGDPDARSNAELRLQTLLVELGIRTAEGMNRLTLILVIATVLNVILVAIQIFIAD